MKQRRHVKARIAAPRSSYPHLEPDRIPMGAIPADQAKLVHDKTYGPRPRYYIDTRFTCVECGAEEVWPAADQKWWYEEAKGKVASTANRCSPCRRKRRLRRSQERRVHIEGLIAKYGIEEAALRLSLSLEALERMRARWRE